MAGTILFYIFALVAAASAVGVALSRRIVRTAVCLFLTLVSVAGLYFLLHAEFLAAVQLVVYAGGTLILIVFGVMLTSNAPSVTYAPSRPQILIALMVGALMLSSLSYALIDWSRRIGYPTTPIAATMAADPDAAMMNLGAALLGDYLLPFELVSVVLLAVMIGAAYLAKSRRDTASLLVDADAAARSRR